MSVVVTKQNLPESVYLLTNRVLSGQKVSIQIDSADELYIFSDEYVLWQTDDVITMDQFIQELEQHVVKKA